MSDSSQGWKLMRALFEFENKDSSYLYWNHFQLVSEVDHQCQVFDITTLFESSLQAVVLEN
jgi:hypothetical protein